MVTASLENLLPPDEPDEETVFADGECSWCMGSRRVVLGNGDSQACECVREPDMLAIAKSYAEDNL